MADVALETTPPSIQERNHLDKRHLKAELANGIGPLLAGLAGLVGIGIALGMLLVHGENSAIVRGDVRFENWLGSNRTSLLNTVTHVSTYLAESIPIAVVWVVAMVVSCRIARSWVPPLFLLFTIGGEKLSYLLTLLAVGRDRPDIEPLGHVYASSSFPSGHVGRRSRCTAAC